MDYGIEGRVALVAASSKGLGKACATGSGARGSKSRALRPQRRRIAESGAGDPIGHWRRGVRAGGRHEQTGRHRERDRGGAGPFRPYRHPGYQRRRAAAGTVHGFHGRRLAGGAEPEPAQHHSHDSRRHAADAGATVGPYRQHHLGDGQAAVRAIAALQRVARRGRHPVQDALQPTGQGQRADQHRVPRESSSPTG